MRRLAAPLLAVGLFAFIATASAQPDKPPAAFPPLPDTDTWAKLPPRKNPPLPAWAKTLAGSLPKTAAKMLELDYLQRAENPLGPILSARIRGVVAKSLGSKYGEAIALADLRGAGGFTDLELDVNPTLKQMPYTERIAMAFARKLTEEGHAITDKEFAEVLKFFGPEKTTAIVHTVAYANFHNRIILGLGVQGESHVAPPMPVKFDLDAAKLAPPARPPWEDLQSVTAGGLSVRLDWSKSNSEELTRTLDRQKERTLRIPLPHPSAFEKLPPKEQEGAKRILWNTVSAGYQPEMTRAWFACLYAFYEEAKPDRIFTNSVFWVVTRTNDCFY